MKEELVSFNSTSVQESRIFHIGIVPSKKRDFITCLFIQKKQQKTSLGVQILGKYSGLKNDIILLDIDLYFSSAT